MGGRHNHRGVRGMGGTVQGRRAPDHEDSATFRAALPHLWRIRKRREWSLRYDARATFLGLPTAFPELWRERDPLRELPLLPVSAPTTWELLLYALLVQVERRDRPLAKMFLPEMVKLLARKDSWVTHEGRLYPKLSAFLRGISSLGRLDLRGKRKATGTRRPDPFLLCLFYDDIRVAVSPLLRARFRSEAERAERILRRLQDQVWPRWGFPRPLPKEAVRRLLRQLGIRPFEFAIRLLGFLYPKKSTTRREIFEGKHAWKRRFPSPALRRTVQATCVLLASQASHLSPYHREALQALLEAIQPREPGGKT